MKRCTPILSVESIEPSLKLWEDLGFEVTMKVPSPQDPKRLAFAAVKRDVVEVMYQTLESLKEDLPVIAEQSLRGFLYLEVEDLERIEGRLESEKILVPKRETFYGATEIAIQEIAGHIIVFAQMKEPPAS